jgi:hypothetical protein
MSVALIKISWHRGWSTRESSKNYVIEQYQELDDLDKVAYKLASEMSGKNKLPFLSLELQVTIIRVSIRKILVA